MFVARSITDIEHHGAMLMDVVMRRSEPKLA